MHIIYIMHARAHTHTVTLLERWSVLPPRRRSVMMDFCEKHWMMYSRGFCVKMESECSVCTTLYLRAAAERCARCCMRVVYAAVAMATTARSCSFHILSNCARAASTAFSSRINCFERPQLASDPSSKSLPFNANHCSPPTSCRFASGISLAGRHRGDDE